MGNIYIYRNRETPEKLVTLKSFGSFNKSVIIISFLFLSLTSILRKYIREIRFGMPNVFNAPSKSCKRKYEIRREELDIYISARIVYLLFCNH